MSITQTVAAIGRLGFTGNVTPKIWYKQISLPSGRPDHKAITLLSEILYWYRPTEIRDEHTGQVIGHRKKFSDDKLQRSYQSFADDFGMTKREVQDSLKRLRDAGLITLELRSKTVGGNHLSNILFIEPVAVEIDRITFPIVDDGVSPNCNTSSENSEDTPREDVGAPTLERGTYTEITTKTSTETKNLDLLSDSGESNELAVIDDSVSFDVTEKNKMLTEAFEYFWFAYQKKTGRKTAEKAFLKINFPKSCDLKKRYLSKRDMLDHLKQARFTAREFLQNIIDQAGLWGDLYASAPADQKQYQPHPATWINNERWNDEELPTIRRTQGFGGSQPPAIVHDNRQGVNDALSDIHDTDWM
ncbi:hypothetical protein C0J08_14630 [Marinomonas sp. CT5]|uniref:hypothetical protein n=1 Tax=Marinomonas sp. CT5 TaxID=2066133 RepID=UPI001BAF375C|nr:hypothetical protein [Marinomonas sp. CT5]QUX96556.1 hypothetical protein C0J08_14630 [Marinomonas sp. CT5]